MTVHGLLEAASVLEDLAAGRAVLRPRITSGALALEAFCQYVGTDHDIAEAAVGLRLLAEGGSQVLNDEDRTRAAQLAAAVARGAAAKAYSRADKAASDASSR